MNVIARLEYELAYYDSAVHRFNHYTTRTPQRNLWWFSKHSVQVARKLIWGAPTGPSPHQIVTNYRQQQTCLFTSPTLSVSKTATNLFHSSCSYSDKRSTPRLKTTPSRAGSGSRHWRGNKTHGHWEGGWLKVISTTKASIAVFADCKENKSIRVVANFKRIFSKVLVDLDPYPMPRICHLYNKIGEGNKYFASLDLHSSYWQIVIDKRNRHKTGFTWRGRCYQYMRLAFGLTSAG